MSLQGNAVSVLFSFFPYSKLNYDVGNRPAEEWGHWLKEAKQPLDVWTDHKNLA